MKGEAVKLFLGQLKSELRISQEHKASKLVVGELARLHALEFGQLRRVFALNPKGLVGREGLVGTLRSVLVLQTVLNDFVLKSAHGANHFAAVGDQREQLGDTLVHQLIDSLGELLGLHGVRVVDEAKVFGGEGGNFAKVKLFTAGQAVADAKKPGIG